MVYKICRIEFTYESYILIKQLRKFEINENYFIKDTKLYRKLVNKKFLIGKKIGM